MPASLLKRRGSLNWIIPAAAVITGTAASPATATQLGGQYFASTQVSRGGYYDPATGRYIDHTSASSSPTNPEPDTPQYSAQEGGGGWRVSAYADDTHGGTVAALAGIAYIEDRSAGFIDQLTATAQLTYTFSVDGPAGDSVPVLMHITGLAENGLAPGGITAAASAGYSFSTAQASDPKDYISFSKNTDVYGLGGAFDDARLMDLKVGNIYTLFMGSSVTVGSYTVSPDLTYDIATATVDPTFTIQGRSPQSYRLVGLPTSAIGNVAPVPEPASWALMVAGFGMLGATLRRSRKGSHAQNRNTPSVQYPCDNDPSRR